MPDQRAVVRFRGGKGQAVCLTGLWSVVREHGVDMLRIRNGEHLHMGGDTSWIAACDNFLDISAMGKETILA